MKCILLSVDQVTACHFGKPVFENLSFTANKGEQWAILGNSGAGKTAFLELLRGRFTSINGRVSFPYIETYKQAHGLTESVGINNRLIAFVQQQAQFKTKENNANFFYQQRFHAGFAEDAITVEEYLQQQEQENKVQGIHETRFTRDWVVEHLRLAELLPKRLIQLSNGETRRLMIAYALLQQPLVVLLDNPFLGLDVKTRSLLTQLLTEMMAKGTQVIMATTLREIPDCMTHILLLDDRKIQYSGSKSGFDKAEFYFESKGEMNKLNNLIINELKSKQVCQDFDFKTVFTLEDVNVHYKEHYILKAINWEVKKGERWALTGPNGSGKSTLLSLINGDHPQAYANTITVFDKKRGSGESIWTLKRRIGYMSPELHQYFKGRNTVLTVVLSGLEDNLGFRRKPASAHEKELPMLWLKLLNLETQAEQQFKQLSVGEQRLVLLLRALIKNPPLLILDEPCQGLDIYQKQRFIRVVNRLYDSATASALIYVSHYPEDIPECVQDVFCL